MSVSVLGFYPTRPDVPSLELPSTCVESISGGRAWEFAEHAVLQGKVKREFIGPEVPPLRIALGLHAELGINPAAVRAALQAYGDAGEVFELSASSGRVYGLFCVQQIGEHEVSEEIVNVQPLSLVLTITLVDPGDEDIVFFSAPTPIALEGNAADTTDVPKDDNPGGDASSVSPAEIARR